MVDKEELAELLLYAVSVYRKHDLYAMSKDLQDEIIVKLNSYGVLNVSSIGAIVGVSKYRVERALEHEGWRSPTRGRLNPAHLTMLINCLANHDIPARWVELMTHDGTDISIIADLTNISEKTIRRRIDV
jgi:hypothetical protein